MKNELSVAVDGSWGDWSQWSDCSRTCGGVGSQARIRLCDSPSPSNGGADCPGKNAEFLQCNTEPCFGIYLHIFYGLM